MRRCCYNNNFFCTICNIYLHAVSLCFTWLFWEYDSTQFIMTLSTKKQTNNIKVYLIFPEDTKQKTVDKWLTVDTS